MMLQIPVKTEALTSRIDRNKAARVDFLGLFGHTGYNIDSDSVPYDTPQLTGWDKDPLYRTSKSRWNEREKFARKCHK